MSRRDKIVDSQKQWRAVGTSDHETCTVHTSLIIHATYKKLIYILCLPFLLSCTPTFLCPTTRRSLEIILSPSLSHLLCPSLSHPNVVSKQPRKLNHNYTPDIDLWSLPPPPPLVLSLPLHVFVLFFPQILHFLLFISFLISSER